MNRWGWLVVLPYVVVCDAKNRIGEQCQVRASSSLFTWTVIRCAEKYICEDMAETLNESHERRRKKHPYDGLTAEQLKDLLEDRDMIERRRKK